MRPDWWPVALPCIHMLFLMRVFSPFFTALLPFCVCVFFFFAYGNMLLHTQIEEAGNFFSFIFFSAMKVTGAYSNFCKGYIKKQDKQKRAGFTEK